MKINRLSILALAAFIFSLNSCKKDDDVIIPPDSDPIITLLSPSAGYAIDFRGQGIPLNFRLDDNEQLNAYWVTETWVSVEGTEYIKINDVYTPEQVISGTNTLRSFTYTIPTSQIQDYTTVYLTAYCRDNKGKVASATVRINVLPDPGNPPAYGTQKYTDSDTIFSVLTGSRNYFSFIEKTNMPSGPGAWDIGEVSVGLSSGGPGFTAILNAPTQGATDSVFAITNTSMFNYEDCDYNTIWQAYVTSNQFYKTTRPLVAGDIVIMKLPTAPHFAVLKILAVWPSTAEIIFSYAYTY